MIIISIININIIDYDDDYDSDNNYDDVDADIEAKWRRRRASGWNIGTNFYGKMEKKKFFYMLTVNWVSGIIFTTLNGTPREREREREKERKKERDLVGESFSSV